MNNTTSAVQIFNNRAADYQQKFMDVSLYHDGLDIFCAQLSSGAKVLDVACGPGNIAHYISQKNLSFQLTGIDLAPAMLELARINNPGADFVIADARSITSIGKKFNGIVAGFCFPYLSKSEAIQFIADAASILLSKGMLYISTMEDDHAKSAFTKGSKGEEMFTNYHEESYLTAALKANNFEVVNINRKIYSEGKEKETVDIIIVAKFKD